MYQWNRIDSSESNPITYGYLVQKWEMFQMSEERIDYLITAGSTSYPFGKIKKVRWLLHTPKEIPMIKELSI